MRFSFHVPWFGLFLAAVTITLQTATHFDPALHPELQGHLALDWDALESLELYRIVVSPFLQTGAGFSPTILGLTTLAVPVYEVCAGTRRAVITFFAGDWLSTLPILFSLKVAGWLGSASAARLVSQPDSGSSSGGFACLGAFTLLLPWRLRLLAICGLAGFFAVRLVAWHRLYDFQHIVATLVGMAVWTSGLAAYRRAVAAEA